MADKPRFNTPEQERRKLDELIERSRAAVERSREIRKIREELIPRDMIPKRD